MDALDAVMLAIALAICIISSIAIWKMLRRGVLEPSNPDREQVTEQSEQNTSPPAPIARPVRPPLPPTSPSTVLMSNKHNGEEKSELDVNLKILFNSGNVYCGKCGSPLTPDMIKEYFVLQDGVLEKHYVCGGCGKPVLPPYKAEVSYRTPSVVKLKILEMKKAMLDNISRENQPSKEHSIKSAFDLLVCRGCEHFDSKGYCKLHNKKVRWDHRICQERLLELLQAAASGELDLEKLSITPRETRKPDEKQKEEVMSDVGRVDGNTS